MIIRYFLNQQPYQARWSWGQIMSHWIYGNGIFHQDSSRRNVHQVLQVHHETQKLSILLNHRSVLGFNVYFSIIIWSNYCSCSSETEISSILRLYTDWIHESLFFNALADFRLHILTFVIFSLGIKNRIFINIADENINLHQIVRKYICNNILKNNIKPYVIV